MKLNIIIWLAIVIGIVFSGAYYSILHSDSSQEQQEEVKTFKAVTNFSNQTAECLAEKVKLGSRYCWRCQDSDMPWRCQP